MQFCSELCEQWHRFGWNFRNGNYFDCNVILFHVFKLVVALSVAHCVVSIKPNDIFSFCKERWWTILHKSHFIELLEKRVNSRTHKMRFLNYCGQNETIRLHNNIAKENHIIATIQMSFIVFWRSAAWHGVLWLFCHEVLCLRQTTAEHTSISIN